MMGGQNVLERGAGVEVFTSGLVRLCRFLLLFSPIFLRRRSMGVGGWVVSW